MFDIPRYDNTNRASMNSAKAQISTARGKSALATVLSGAVLVGGAVAVINGIVNAEYANLAAQIGANVPEAAVSLVGGTGLITHVVYNARLKKAKKAVDFDIAVDDAVQRRTRRP